MRSILDLSIEGLQTLSNEGDGRNRIMTEDVLMVDWLVFYAVADLYDHHRDMWLDMDNMFYEELLALEKCIGNVSTRLTEESISKCLKKSVYSPCTNSSSIDETSQKYNMCQEEYDQKR